ncbi:MAG TPA: UvrD-helicase domain-containing protein [Vicinamibacterales bacterium]|nr:UvrD-helicase domain-containing protein [Vicinamibacterales bacterium]
MPTDVWLPFDAEPETVESRIDARDRAGRERAVDPRFNVALEASAGTGKTRILVERYVNLLKAGVDPAEILALTFTRKAATEMRDRILVRLREAASLGELAPRRWRELRDRIGDVAISTIDAFCLSLLREFPLEADLDPGFSVADETEVPRLVDESLDRALRVCRGLARDDEHVALVFAQLGDRRARRGLATLLHHRIAAPAILARYLDRGPRDLTIDVAARQGAARLLDVFGAMRGGIDRFVETGPLEPAFQVLVDRLAAVQHTVAGEALDPVGVHAAFVGVREHFLTQDGQPRTRMAYTREDFASAIDWQTHRDLVVGHGAAILEAHTAYRRDLNVLVSRGVWRMYRVAESEYRRTLDAHALLDFPDLLLRARDLLRQMEEFARSRYRLESRYHHVLVDEFQDTSRAQWDLISLLTDSWGEGSGLAHTGALQPSIFIVGDRKQSIYAFRDADVSILREASRHLEMLRPDRDVRRSISRSFRSTTPLLAFVNDVCQDVEKAPARRDAFVYDEEDRFPLGGDVTPDSDAVSLIVGATPEECAEATSLEIARLIDTGTVVRDRETGLPRAVRASDVAVLFRARDSHRDFEDALERRGLPSYVYKGLGFFDTDEIKDVRALLSYLADPLSSLHAAAWLRSRFIRITDEGLRRLAPSLADALLSEQEPRGAASLDEEDRDALTAARRASRRWRALVDRVPPAELLDIVLGESAYMTETRGPRARQARENLKKIRAIIRRLQNRGYATLDRIVSHLDRLALGDEANAVIDASDAVSLMTVHAAKGLEFPVVFVVNLARGTGTRRPPIRVATGEAGEDPSVAVGDYQSRGDEDSSAREREETKRLLYVALTRARDRLYLSTVLKDGQIKPGRGSLAEVLPMTLQACFAGAACGTTPVPWTATSGTVHSLGVCRGSDSARATTRATVPTPEAVKSVSDFAMLSDEEVARSSVADAIATVDSTRPSAGLESPRDARRHEAVESHRLIGTLVHRLLQREGLRDDVTDEWMTDRIALLVRSDDQPDSIVIDDLHTRAAAAYKAFAADPDVRAIYRSGEPLHEVPFSLAVEGRIVHGAIDCLVRTAQAVTVLEFKTGIPRPEHEIQAGLYRLAASSLFPGVEVTARLVYAHRTHS